MNAYSQNNNESSAKKWLPHLWTIIVILFLLMIGYAGYKFKDVLLPKEQGILAVAKPSCDLRKQACESNLPTGETIVFSILPKDIPLLKPITLNVEVKGLKVDQVDILFVGIGMDMGYNHAKLDKKSVGRFTGTGILPVCTLKRMDWEARLYLNSEKGLIKANYKFYTLK